MSTSSIPNIVKLGVMGACAFFGGYVASFGPQRAYAQIRQLPPQGNPRVQPTVTDTIVVPPQGVRFVSADGKPVMVLGAQGTQSTLALFDSNGLPTVTISAGNGGYVNISTSGSTAQVTATSANRTNQTSVQASTQETAIYLERNNQKAVIIRDDVANGSRLSMASRSGKTAMDIVFGNNRGAISLMDDSGQSVGTFGFSGSNGSLELKDAKKKTATNVSGEGKLTMVDGDKTTWAAPPASDK